MLIRPNEPFVSGGLKIIILIGGGTKKRQQQDIDRAVALWEDYKRRKASTAKGK
jgi:hypothetical protein